MINKYKLYHIAGYLLLALIIYFAVDPATLFDDLKKISLPVAIILILVATIDRFTMAAKWMQLCSALNFSTRFFQYLKMYYVATFLGYCLPTSLGGEVYKAARLSRFEQSHDVLASMFMEKIVAVFSTVSFAWAGVLYITFNLTSEKSAILFYILAGFTVTALLATWASMHPLVQGKIISLLSKYRIGKYFEKLTSAYSSYKQQLEVIFWNFLLAIFESSLQLAILCGIGIALNIDVPLPILVSIIAITEFIRRIAIILDGWGLATALQIFMYSLVGISVESALLIALLSHAVHLVASLPGGILMLTDRWDKN
ncbi:MAG: lysylphosphatidylglycerol synthase transmembrane domain-containing protein [Gammaproteobacteria bacterium]|nr:lysylphosphatidylglycerol synthase transmembrane domain-containing protein [Gammaproteobacteria bacterium]